MADDGPSERGARPDEAAARRRVSYTLLYVALALALLLALNEYVRQTVRPSLPIAYSTFREQLAAGKVKDVLVTPDELRGELTEPLSLPVVTGEEGRTETITRFTVVRVPGDDQTLMRDIQGAPATVQVTGRRDDGLFRSILLFWILPSVLLFGGLFLLLRVMSPNRQVMSFGKSRARLYAERETKVTFEQVAGIEEAKEELSEVVEFLRDPRPYQKLGARIPRGILLVGPPGTGKTLLARAVAGEANVVFFSLSGSDFVEMFAGVGASRVRDLFEQAQKSAPCIVFIDELDALGKVRGVGFTGAHDEREQTLNQLLSEMDGFDPNKGVVILAATNRPEILDPALLRPGRFDRQVVVDRPDVKGREAILRIHAQKVKLGPDTRLDVIARQTPGLVGADLANIVNEAALLAGRRKLESVGQGELEEAIQRAFVGLERKRRVMSLHEKERIAVHETGHALTAMSVPGADPVTRVSIIARGIGAGGYTLMTPSEDRSVITKPELEDRLCVLLGGRAAEQLIYADTSTGASDDLSRAVEIARRMVVEFGMNERFGPVNLGGHRQRFVAGGLEPQGPPDYSDQTARELDEEVRRILTEAEARVTTILRSREEALRGIAARLIEKEVIQHEELEALARAHGAEPLARTATELRIAPSQPAAAAPG